MRNELTMIVIINGSLGVGKTETSWELMTRFDRAVMLDGDYIGAVHPFEIYDQDRVDYVYETLALLVNHHRCHGYENFVINYVFEQPFQLKKITSKLVGFDTDLHYFWLTCEEAEQATRIVERTVDCEWELKRYIELNKIMKEADLNGNIGSEIITTNKTVAEVADEIYGRVV